jgi:hypothetical protein
MLEKLLKKFSTSMKILESVTAITTICQTAPSMPQSMLLQPPHPQLGHSCASWPSQTLSMSSLTTTIVAGNAII